MGAIVLNESFDKSGELTLPEHVCGINPHNLYLYVKSYQAAARANTASSKTRTEVSGGGKKPWAQKGRGTARSGSRRSPVWVGGGISHGPNSNRNYTQKVNRKQKKLALFCALEEHAEKGTLFIVDKIEVPTGKTKDANAMFKKLGVTDALFVKNEIDYANEADGMSERAFRNLFDTYLIEANELNAYLATLYRGVVIEKAVWENLSSKADLEVSNDG